MKKINNKFNELMVIALIAFIPMTMLNCSVEEVVVEDTCSYDSSIIGQYSWHLNENVVYTFTIDTWTTTQDGFTSDSRSYCVTEDSTIGLYGYIIVEQNGSIDYVAYNIVSSDSIDGIILDGEFYYKL